MGNEYSAWGTIMLQMQTGTCKSRSEVALGSPGPDMGATVLPALNNPASAVLILQITHRKKWLLPLRWNLHICRCAIVSIMQMRNMMLISKLLSGWIRFQICFESYSTQPVLAQ